VAVGADDGGVGRHLGHGQPAPGRRDRVTLVGVCLLACSQLEELSFEVVVVGDGRGWRGHGGVLSQLSGEIGRPAPPAVRTSPALAVPPLQSSVLAHAGATVDEIATME
jgi:hypothetical protein